MANTAAVNQVTKETLEEVRKILKSKGYKMKKHRQSANVEWVFTKGNDEIAFDGWDANPRWGSMALIMGMWRNAKPTEVFVMPGRSTDEYGAGMPESTDALTDEEFAVYKQNCKKALEYLKKRARHEEA